jgi:hypothetical protein
VTFSSATGASLATAAARRPATATEIAQSQARTKFRSPAWPTRAETFSDLLEAAYDLHRTTLYQQL